MYPQSELENYKLQVELLQEKLKRSEERHQQLEEKFENIMKRRSEHERLIRAKSRLKYEQFLQEQTERNERNKSLIRALERIDQQAASLAARSERLKILKVQYELYFNKMLEFRGISNAHFNYNIYGLPQTMPVASHFNYSADSNSRNTRVASTMTEVDDGNFESMPELDSYRHADTIIPKNPIELTSGVASHQRQLQGVNLKPNTRAVIATTTGISSPDPHNQSPLFADTRISIDSSRYKGEDPKAIDYRYDGGSGVVSRAKTTISASDRPPTSEQLVLGENSNETQGPGMSYRGEDTLKPESTAFSSGSEPSLSSEDSLAPKHQSQPFTLDKLHPINRDEALGKLFAKLYDDAIKKDGDEGEKSSEKSQPRCAIEGKNMSAIKEKIMDTMESQLTLAQITEKVAKDNMSSRNNASDVLNHSGRVDKLVTDYFPSFKKREKLSIESIENAIYGELITPAPTISEGKLSLERLGDAFSENLRIDSNKSDAEMNLQKEKSDESAEIFPTYKEIVDNEQSMQSYVNGNVKTESSQDAYANNIGSESYREPELNYDRPIENFNVYDSEQYLENQPTFSDQQQLNYSDQEQAYQEYKYDQDQDQDPQQTYEPSHTQDPQFLNNEDVYGPQGNQSYDDRQNLQYSEYTEQNYPANQYETYEQPYMNQYPETEFDTTIQSEDTSAQMQVQPVINSEYGHEQEPMTANTYDPNAQYYLESQYDQSNSQENPPQQYYEYESDQIPNNSYEIQPQDHFQSNEQTTNSDNEQIPSGSYDLQPQDYQQSTEPFNQSLIAEDPVTFEPEPAAHEMAAVSSEEAHILPSEEVTDEVFLANNQVHEEITSNEAISLSDSPEAAKPTSILATSEKSYDSLPAAAKNKKKKRVNFLESDPNAAKPSSSVKSENNENTGNINSATK